MRRRGYYHSAKSLLAVNDNVSRLHYSRIYAAEVEHSEEASLKNIGNYKSDLVKMRVHQDLRRALSATSLDKHVASYGVGHDLVKILAVYLSYSLRASVFKARERGHRAKCHYVLLQALCACVLLSFFVHNYPQYFLSRLLYCIASAI